MGSFILFGITALFLIFAYGEYKNNQGQWAAVFFIAALAVFAMAMLSRY
jgi:hypothetical protein